MAMVVINLVDPDAASKADALRFANNVDGAFFDSMTVYGFSVGRDNSSLMKAALEDGKNCVLLASSLVSRPVYNLAIHTLGDDSASLADKRVAVNLVWPAVKVAYKHVHQQWLNERSMHRLFSDLPEIFREFQARREAREQNQADADAEMRELYDEEGSEEEHSDGEPYEPSDAEESSDED